jgi:hypothetical protein
MLLHDGQLDGARTRVPVQLGRAPVEPADDHLAAWHRRVLRALDDPTLRAGDSAPAEIRDHDGGSTAARLVARTWDGSSRWLVVVNLADTAAAAEVATGWSDLRGRACRLVDPTTDEAYDREGDAVADGLHIELGALRWHLFRVEPDGG